MSDVLYLAWRYLAYHRFKSAIMVASITIIVYLPVGLRLLTSESGKQLTSRAEATPLLVGAKGSPLELVLSGLYFESDVPPTMRFAELTRIEASGFAQAIPLHTRFRTRHSPIVGTSLDYLDMRSLKIARGRKFALLGECVLGARAARAAGVDVDGSVMSAPESVFDIAGVYPLKMKVVGVLEPSGGADDRAVFVDLKTAWVIEGLGHGHASLQDPANKEGVLRREGNKIVANASVMQYNEITPENVKTFHFHGDRRDFPLTAVIANPFDRKSSSLLQGRYLGDDELVQIARPSQVMGELLQTVLTVERYIQLAVALIGIATLATLTMVFALSLQLRRREIETMIKIGGSRNRIASVVAAEIIGVLAAGVLLAGLLTLATGWLASSATRLLIQMT